jgi:hypothetical protein
MFHTKVVEKTKTHILCSVTFFLQNRTVYQIMWRNTAELGRTQTTIWRTSIACLIPKATNSLSEYVILTDFPLQQWLYVSMNAPECYVIPTLLVLFCFKLVQALNQSVASTNLTTLGQTSLGRANAII